MCKVVLACRRYVMALALMTFAADVAAQGAPPTGSVIRSERGALTRTDSAFRGGQYYDYYTLDLREGVAVTIELRSTDFNVRLVVTGPDFESVLDVDDTPGFGFDVRETLVPTRSGPFAVMVTSLERATLGSYELVVSVAAPGAVASQPAASLPFSIRGILVAGDRDLGGGALVDLVHVALPARRPVTVTLTSDDFDVYLVVLAPDQSVALEVDDSPGHGRNVSATMSVDAAGPYLFAVGNARVGETGAYALDVRLAPDGGAAAAPARDAQPPAAPAGEGASGIVGPLGIGGFTRRQLTGRPAAVAYHTYVVTVPEGLQRLTLELQADVDLDLFVKHGSEIVDLNDGGDWEARDVALAPTALIVLEMPRPGRYFVDVVWLGGEGTATYLITAR
jgi:hypothetical protein